MCNATSEELLQKISFQIDGVECGSFKSFMFSLAYSDLREQRFVYQIKRPSDITMVGKIIPDWTYNNVLYWQGVPVPRNSLQFHDLIMTALYAICLQARAQYILRHMDNKTLTEIHVGGKSEVELVSNKELRDALLTIQEVLNTGLH